MMPCVSQEDGTFMLAGPAYDREGDLGATMLVDVGGQTYSKRDQTMLAVSTVIGRLPPSHALLFILLC